MSERNIPTTYTPAQLRRMAETRRHDDHPYTAAMLVWAAGEIERLRGVLRQIVELQPDVDSYNKSGAPCTMLDDLVRRAGEAIGDRP